MKTRSQKISNIVKNVFIWVISLTMLVPLILVIDNSFKDQYSAAAMQLDFPKAFHFENYINVIEKGKLIQAFVNSSLYAVASVAIGVVVTSMAAYVMARNRTKLNNFLYFFMVLGMAMPINYVTLTKVMQLTGLMNKQIGLILVYTAMSIPFSIFLLYGFIGSIPRDLDEAGIIDGCSTFRLFLTVVFPLLKPVIVTLVILNFLNTWNDFINPLYFLSSATKWPMTLAVYNFFGRYQNQWHLVSADVVLTCIPVIAIYLFGQKYIIAGMTAGSVKA
jgi:raffinose/stachyose/melibiose transport system permease protein